MTLSSETGYCKPDREIFNAAVRALDVPVSDVLLVGDSLHDDVEAAIAAGLNAVLIDRGRRYPEVRHVPQIFSLKDILTLVTDRP